MELNLGMTPAVFMAEYWQKQPLLVRQALPGLVSPVAPDELAGLACEELVESRIVCGPDGNGNWTLENGPFPEARFEDLGDQDWTLLIQDADKLLESVESMLEPFRFLPDWRIDDIMISFAAPGGSVGPHWDHYDVFLIQTQGHRRWLVDDSEQPDLSYQPGHDLKLMSRFEPNQAWRLAPGDLLYLPPGMPHHGIAEDACVTCSVGMRAPSVEEILIDHAETLAQGLTEHHRYRDPDRQPSSDPGQIDELTSSGIRAMLESHLTMNESEFRQWLGKFLTRYRLPHELAAPPDTEMDPTVTSLIRNPWSKLAWCKNGNHALLFASGNAYPATASAASLLCRRRRLGPEQLRLLDHPDDRAMLAELVKSGHLVATDD
jgi:50S ribosomal protein L16 3-hydroxylase